MQHKVTDRIGYILSNCQGKRVLHLGCADAPYTEKKVREGTLLHGRIEKVAAALYGVDVSVEAIELLRNEGYTNLAVANAEDLTLKNPFSSIEFDIVVAGEILEHLSNPGLFLDGVRLILKSSSSRLLLTTVNAYCAYRFAYTFLTGREGVHPDHVYYFSPSTLVKLVTKHGYEVEDLSFYPADEYENDLNHGYGRVLWWSDRLARRFHPALADGVMIICKIGEKNKPFSTSR